MVLNVNLSQNELTLFILLLSSISIEEFINIEDIEKLESLDKDLDNIKDKFFKEIASKQV